MAHLIFGGVMDRFPKLGSQPAARRRHVPVARSAAGTTAEGAARAQAHEEPAERVPRRFTYDTIGHDDRINAALVRLVGADRVTLGSDYCFDMGLDDPLATVNRIAGLSAEDRERICGGNARKLLRSEFRTMRN